MKSQILAGGRGLGKFKSGLQGGVHICSVEEAPKLAEQMLGQVRTYAVPALCHGKHVRLPALRTENLTKPASQRQAQNL